MDNIRLVLYIISITFVTGGILIGRVYVDRKQKEGGNAQLVVAITGNVVLDDGVMHYLCAGHYKASAGDIADEGADDNAYIGAWDRLQTMLVWREKRA